MDMVRRMFDVFRGVSPTAVIAAALLCLIYGSFLVHSITLVTADLGRHVKNGELLFSLGQTELSRSIPSSSGIPPSSQPVSVMRHNFYSYTQPDLQVPNHHWGSGALFYIVWQQFGWRGVHFLFIGLSVVTFLVFYSLAATRAGTGAAALVALAIIPLLAERTEIRPEAFSYFFSGIFLWLLLKFREKGVSFRAVLLLFFGLEVLWVNSHIYFFLGPLLVGAFLTESLVLRFAQSGKRIEGDLPQGGRTLQWSALLGGTVLGALSNPFGVQGMIYPFTILRNYGYRLAENQPVWFMEKLTQDPNFMIFKLVFWFSAVVLLILPFVPYGALRRVKRMPDIASFLLFAGVSAMAWLQVRNLALFGFFALPLTAVGITRVFGEMERRYHRELAAGAVALLVLVLFIAFSGDVQKFFPHWREFGLGLEEGDSAAAEFFKREHLTGPILNNYDIGGYLIFHLFPSERVFVDNRPEAYSESFLQETYIQLQESEETWKEALEHYEFNVIFFSHRDATPWGQSFLIARVSDPDWAPVFVDRQVIIFLRNTDANRSIIEKHAIPRENFGVVTPAG